MRWQQLRNWVTFQFHQGQVAENQPITVLVFLGESLGILQNTLFISSWHRSILVPYSFEDDDALNT